MKYLIDTCIISELTKKQPSKQVVTWFKNIGNDELYISVLTLGELRKGIDKLPESQKKHYLQAWLENQLTDWFEDKILSITQEVANCWGQLQAKTNRPIPAIDSLIAATAISNNLSIVTRNEKDFNYPGLTVINPWEMIG